MNNSIASSALIYDQVKISGSSVGAESIIGDNTDLIRSDIAERCSIGRRNLIIDSTFQKGTYTGANSIIKATEVKKYCAISWDVSIGGDQHNYEAASIMDDQRWADLFDIRYAEDEKHLCQHGCEIGNEVWIGSGANILTGITVGDGAVVGAGAVVTKNVPPYAVVLGVPAKVHRFRFDAEVIARLLQLRWWDWCDEAIKEAALLLHGNLTLAKLEQLEQVARLELP